MGLVASGFSVGVDPPWWCPQPPQPLVVIVGRCGPVGVEHRDGMLGGYRDEVRGVLAGLIDEEPFQGFAVFRTNRRGEFVDRVPDHPGMRG